MTAAKTWPTVTADGRDLTHEEWRERTGARSLESYHQKALPSERLHQMTRSRASAKKAGASFERLIADHLARVLEDDRIDRRVKTGASDRGDIGGVRVHGQRIVIEAKDYGGRLMPGPWIQEAQTEAGNDDALLGLVIAKRRGTTNPGQMFVLMTVDELVSLLTGNRDHTNQETE